MRQNTHNDKRRRRPFWANLRFTLVMAFIVLSVAPLSAVLYGSVTLTGAYAEQQAIEKLDAVSQSKEDTIQIYLRDNQAHLRLLFAETHSQSMVIDFLTTAEPERAEQAHLVDYLVHNLESQDHYVEFFLYDVEGNILVSTDEKQTGKVVRNRPYYAHSLDEEHIQPPLYEVGSQALNIVISRPIKNRARKVVGVFAGRLNLDRLAELMGRRTGMGETGETYLVSLENNYFLTPSRFEGYSPTRRYHSEGIDRALGGTNGAGVYLDYREPPATVLGAYRWIPEIEAALLTEVDQAEALGAATQTTQISTGVAALAAAVSVAMGLAVALRITGPIAHLTEVARRLAAGKLGARAKVRQKNEIGEMADSFNTMTDQLQAMINEQEAISAELEESLEEIQISEAERERLQQEIIDSQRQAIRELSSPVIPIMDEVIVMPLVGNIDTQRARDVTRALMRGITRYRAQIIIIDITGVQMVDSGVADHLNKAIQATRLKGARTIVTGISDAVAETIVDLGIDWSTIDTVRDLQTGLMMAIGELGGSLNGR